MQYDKQVYESVAKTVEAKTHFSWNFDKLSKQDTMSSQFRKYVAGRVGKSGPKARIALNACLGWLEDCFEKHGLDLEDKDTVAAQRFFYDFAAELLRLGPKNIGPRVVAQFKAFYAWYNSKHPKHSLGGGRGHLIDRFERQQPIDWAMYGNMTGWLGTYITDEERAFAEAALKYVRSCRRYDPF